MLKARKRMLPFATEELRITWRIIKSTPLTLIASIVVIGFVLVSLSVWISGGRILPYSPYGIAPSSLVLHPSLSHLLGTDDLGRDIFSRVLAASPIDAGVAFSVVGIAAILGLLMGGLAGFFGGIIEEIVMRVTDVFLAFPGLVLALAIVAALGPSILYSVYALIPVWWPSYTRLARSEALAVKSQGFIDASIVSGQRNRRILFRHIFPNVLPIILTYATIDVGNVIIIFSVLSFIGLGAQAPTPEWGLMTVQGEQYLSSAPWIPLAPAIAIVLVALCFSLFGDGLRDALDPKVRGLFG